MVALTNKGEHGPLRHPQKVLVVEDEAISRRALTALLNASGFTAESVGSAEEALHAMSSDGPPPEIALIDLDLPGMNGLELIRRLQHTLPQLRPVLITATSRERLDQVLDSHYVSYMRKPIDFKNLLHVLAAEGPAH